MQKFYCDKCERQIDIPNESVFNSPAIPDIELCKECAFSIHEAAEAHAEERDIIEKKYHKDLSKWRERVFQAATETLNSQTN